MVRAPTLLAGGRGFEAGPHQTKDAMIIINVNLDFMKASNSYLG